MNRDIHKTIAQLFGGGYKFIIPLYQRNFAWGELEITQLLQDLYEGYELGVSYFVGSIVYISRKEDELEIIDGQQRLTVLTLLLNVIGKEFLPNLFASRLEYDSRDEVCQYLESLYSSDNIDNNNNSEIVETFKVAYNTILTCSLTPKKEGFSISYLQQNDIEKLKKFAEYISSRVYFVLAEMPQDTDVATYFEIMNNTGDQLKKHEIVKSLILGTAQNKLNLSQLESLALIWDACSQMDVRIQDSIPAKKRELILGNDFDSFDPENILNLVDEKEITDREEGQTIESIIRNDLYKTDEKTGNIEKDDNQENKGASIIDFPNFLMHIFRLCYNDIYVRNNEEGNDIPLNEKDLLSVFNVINSEKEIDAVEFISKLLYYRIILDRYMVRTEEDDDESRWVLKSPNKQAKTNVVRFSNTFRKNDNKDRGQDNVIKALSMLQVSYPQRKYKRFLNEILSWFRYDTVSYDINWYMPKLNGLIMKYVCEVEKEYGDELYALGTKTPRFVLNVIDYLLYLSDSQSNFDFKYYNSVEHHLPQSSERHQKYSSCVIDSIGNLVLLSRRDNSSLNDKDPLTKVNKAGDFEKFPPNRKFIYQQTKANRRWEEEDIRNNEVKIRSLLSNKKEILKIRELEKSPLLFRACLCVDDYCVCDGSACGGERYDFSNLSEADGQKALKRVTDWLNKHFDLDLEDFIAEQLQTNLSLLEDTWRWCFVKYPSVADYCGNGKFAWVKDGKIIYLLPQNKQCDAMHELRAHVVYDEMVKNGEVVDIDRYGLWLPMKESPFMSRFAQADISLHIWVDEDAEHWCYELWSERNGNASENVALARCGWVKNQDGHYILNNRPFLCGCPANYAKSVQKAIAHIDEIIDIINQVE